MLLVHLFEPDVVVQLYLIISSLKTHGPPQAQNKAF